ncbi:hypothetical protein F4779DRAFT_571407 [Xylariaceae sp. FL0662B]|nr:hypothetical protein F4779DRAFT_571407 [Xylariaceae sp. FL0662B]
MSQQNTTIYLASRPTYHILPGETFKAKTEPAPSADDLKDGEALVETLYLSLDPSMRGVLNARKSYIAPVAIGQKMVGGAITRVLATKTSKVKPGDIIHSFSGWTEIAIVHESALEAISIPEGCKFTDILMVALSVFHHIVHGLSKILTRSIDGPATTAYVGLKNVAKVKPGETVVVSAASGAVGSIVGQMAKIYGARAVGITSSDEKCSWLVNQLGFDAAVKYNSPSFLQDLEAATPSNIDVYWDGVGGQVLDAALARAAKYSRFVLCGGVSEYNVPPEERLGIKNTIEIGKQQIRMEGFVILDKAQEMPEARAQIFKWAAEGKLVMKTTIITGGIDKVEGAFTKLFNGDKLGKLIVEVKST